MPKHAPARDEIILRPTDRFISDLHFSHESMITRHGRPWETVADMDRAMIDHWNSVIADKTRVFFIGDFAFWKAPLERLMWLRRQLAGEIHLLPGNHDPQPVLELKWASILPDITVCRQERSKERIVLSHYPLREWPFFWSGAIHLHGHTHDNLRSSNRSWDVGVDHQGFVPLTLAEIKQRMSLLPNLDFTGVETNDFERDRGPDLEPAGAAP